PACRAPGPVRRCGFSRRWDPLTGIIGAGELVPNRRWTMSTRVVGGVAGVVVLGLVVGGGLLAPAQEKAKDKPAGLVRWEYKVTVGAADEQEMNKLGDDGWELAAAQGLVSGGQDGKGVRTRTS